MVDLTGGSDTVERQHVADIGKFNAESQPFGPGECIGVAFTTSHDGAAR